MRKPFLRSQKFFVKKIRFPPAPNPVIGWRPKNVSAFVSPTNADWILIQKCRKKLSSVHGSSVRTVIISEKCTVTPNFLFGYQEHLLQYCAKVMRANFDEFRHFSTKTNDFFNETKYRRTFNEFRKRYCLDTFEISKLYANVPAKLRTTIREDSRKFEGNVSKFRTMLRIFEACFEVLKCSEFSRLKYANINIVFSLNIFELLVCKSKRFLSVKQIKTLQAWPSIGVRFQPEIWMCNQDHRVYNPACCHYDSVLEG